MPQSPMESISSARTEKENIVKTISDKNIARRIEQEPSGDDIKRLEEVLTSGKIFSPVTLLSAIRQWHVRPEDIEEIFVKLRNNKVASNELQRSAMIIVGFLENERELVSEVDALEKVLYDESTTIQPSALSA